MNGINRNRTHVKTQKHELKNLWNHNEVTYFRQIFGIGIIVLHIMKTWRVLKAVLPGPIKNHMTWESAHSGSLLTQIFQLRLGTTVHFTELGLLAVQRGKHELSLEQTHSRNKLKPVKTQYCQNLPKNLTMQTRKFLENPKILGVPQDCCAMFVAKKIRIVYVSKIQ